MSRAPFFQENVRFEILQANAVAQMGFERRKVGFWHAKEGFGKA